MKAKTTLPLLSMFLVSVLGNSQHYHGKQAEEIIPEAKVVRFTNRSAIPALVELSENGQIKYRDKNSITAVGEILKLNEHLELHEVGVKTDRNGITHYKFKQFYQGIPVFGGTYYAHRKGKELISINGDLYNLEQIETKAIIKAESAINKALNYCGIINQINTPAQTAVLVILPINTNGKQSGFKLAYQLEVSHYFDKAFRVFIDAQTGEVLDKTPTIQTHFGDNKSLSISNFEFVDDKRTVNNDSAVVVEARTKYYGKVEVTVGKEGDYYCFETSDGNKRIGTYDAKNDNNPTKDFEICTKELPINLIENENDKVACDAHYIAEQYYNYLKNVHGRNSLDDKGMKLISYVHVGNNMVNAYWNGKAAFYGDGKEDGPIGPTTVFDVGGVSFTNGLNAYTTNLISSEESGSLVGSFAEILGNVVEHYAQPNSNSDKHFTWAEDAGKALRSLKNPKEFRQPDTYGGEYWFNYDNDGQSVLQNTGVQNYWFYLLVEGGSGTNDNEDTYDVQGIGWDAAEKIVYDNFVNRLTEKATFADARVGSVSAAKEIFGECTQEHISVEMAWYAVGVGEKSECSDKFPVPQFSSDKNSICPGQTINFKDKSSGDPTAWEWKFEGGTPESSTEQNPVVEYQAPGTYKVSLKVTNDAGSRTKTIENYVTATPVLENSIAEEFEDNFPPEHWLVENNNENNTWEKSNVAGFDSKSCMIINNRENSKLGDLDYFISPEFKLGENPALSFYVAYGFDGKHEDSLKVDVSADCGETWTSIYRKSGKALATTEMDGPDVWEWIPKEAKDWRQEIIEMENYNGKTVKFRFENTSFEGNILWIDKVNINVASSVEEQLHEINAGIGPNPNNGSFELFLRGLNASQNQIEIRDVLGALVYEKIIVAPGKNYRESINLETKSLKGVYFLRVRNKKQQLSKKIIIE